ncbi:MAG: hypothetical protein ACPGVA_13930 [Pikeienuella sp.]
MRTLFLHIGHGKTGTSYLQSCFVLSRQTLARTGILYPMGRQDRQAARGATSSGNGTPLAKTLGAQPQNIGRILRPLRRSQRNILFSSEFLFHHMTKDISAEDLLRFADKANCERISVFLLIRDPLDHMRSAYLQNVQRSGLSEHIDGMARRFNMPIRVYNLLTAFDHPRIDITVRNYSRIKEQLTAETEDWLGLSPGTLKHPHQSRVNRSLTAAEMEIQRVFNKEFGPSGRLFADKVIDALPELKPDYPIMGETARQITHDRCANAMRQINRIIPENQAYCFDLLDPPPIDDSDLVTLSEDQVDVIINALARHIKR